MTFKIKNKNSIYLLLSACVIMWLFNGCQASRWRCRARLLKKEDAFAEKILSRYADTCYVFNQQVAWFHCNGMLHSFLLKPNYSTGTYRVKKWKILQSETPDLRDSSMQFCMYDFDGSLLRETHPCFPLQLDGTELSVYIKKEDKIEKFTHEVNVDCLREKDFPKNTFQYYMKKDLELLFE